MSKHYLIKKAAEILNISTNKIRFYEKKGLIKPLRDEENGYRYFTENELIKLQTILMYRELNLSIEGIKDIFEDGSKDNMLNHFHAQWEAINNQIHKMQLIQYSLEEIMDSIYESEDESYKEKIISIIELMHKTWKVKSEWKDKWNFNSWARTYDESVVKDIGTLKFYKKYDMLLDTVFKKAVAGRERSINVLEIGVGTGNLAARFLDEKYNIIGIDQSRDMLNVAKEKFSDLKLRLGDFLKIPFENHKFDVIVSTYAFHHLTEKEKVIAIEEMLRVLKPDGRIVIGDLMFESELDKENMLKSLTKAEVEEIEDEYYSIIEFLIEYFKKHNKRLEMTKIDELVFIVEVN